MCCHLSCCVIDDCNNFLHLRPKPSAEIYRGKKRNLQRRKIWKVNLSVRRKKKRIDSLGVTVFNMRASWKWEGEERTISRCNWLNFRTQHKTQTHTCKFDRCRVQGRSHANAHGLQPLVAHWFHLRVQVCECVCVSVCVSEREMDSVAVTKKKTNENNQRKFKPFAEDDLGFDTLEGPMQFAPGWKHISRKPKN